ncbi:hypothetical protein COU80_06020 [Candidatus Peregrinibacteria bacterium CG10_big_fil_rev_8_21_14_0_10_55_24]|nr:MAG: hypothetical protein COU80_06020 [Candidatus Peregrinibacteria bacterium CG10_big_fil_rev_8_21_14_0_10_55_24]
MESFIFTIYIILTTPLVLLGNGALWVIGYNITNDAKGAAEQIVEEQKEPEECYDIRFFTNVFGPTVDSVRRTCVYEYAKLTSDPSACELLMPSAYGLSCIGAASPSPRCSMEFDRSVRWNNHGGEATIEECQKENLTRPDIGNICCHIASVYFLENVNDCTSIENAELFDECTLTLANKLADPEICQAITSEVLKAACIVRSTALRKYPQLRRR